MFCSICGTEIKSIDDAVEQGWLPSFYDGEIQKEVCCSNCFQTLIQVGEDAEYEVKPEYQGKIVYMDSDSGEHNMVMGIAVRFDVHNN